MNTPDKPESTAEDCESDEAFKVREGECRINRTFVPEGWVKAQRMSKGEKPAWPFTWPDSDPSEE